MTDSTKNPAPIAPSSTAPGSAPKARVAKPEVGTLVKKKGAQAGDPAKMAKPSRTKITATSGAKYGINVSIPAYKSSEAGATQGNGRLFQAAVKRTAPNFKDGVSSQS